MAIEYHDLRSFIDLVKKEGEYVEINGADWNEEIGALTEAASEFIAEPPLLLFDNIKGYPDGYRVVSLFAGSRKRAALAVGLPTDKTRLELIRLLAKKIKSVEPIPPHEVKQRSRDGERDGRGQ